MTNTNTPNVRSGAHHPEHREAAPVPRPATIRWDATLTDHRWAGMRWAGGGSTAPRSKSC